MVARATLTHQQSSSSSCDIGNCRVKRDEPPQQQVARTLEVRLETPKVIFEHQASETLGEKNIEPIILRLRPIDAKTLLSPNYKLVVRGRDRRAVEEDRPWPELDCHFNGHVVGVENSSVAFSICDNNLVTIFYSNKSFNAMCSTRICQPIT